MQKMWFVYDASLVSGPYTTDAVKERLHSGKISLHSRIWWKGQRDWIEISKWQQNLNVYEKNIEQNEEAIWYAEKEGKTQGPITKTELIHLLSDLGNISRVRVWKKGQENWATVYEYSDISNELGITRRKYPRAPLLGEVKMKRENGQQLVAKVTTISAGGMGLSGHYQLSQDEVVTLVLRSPLLVLAVHATARIKHISENYIGMEFLGISDEQRATIMDYVKQFEGPSTQFLKTAS